MKRLRSGIVLGREYRRHPGGDRADLELAVARARAAQAAWAGESFRRARCIFLRFHDLLLERQDEVLDLIQWETGKARRHAFEEILDTAVVSRYYARRAERCCGRGGARAPFRC